MITQYFNNLQDIESNEYFERFKAHIYDRNPFDDTELQIFNTLNNNSNSLTFLIGSLNEEGVQNLNLPHRQKEDENDPGDPPVKLGGNAFYEVVRQYDEEFIPNRRFPKGTCKILSQNHCFFDKEDTVLKADFLSICNERELAHPEPDDPTLPRVHYDDSHGDNKIYINNGFHRLVAYGLWILKNGFRPLEVYFAYRKDSN